MDSDPNIRDKLVRGKFTAVFYPMPKGYRLVVIAALGWLSLAGDNPPSEAKPITAAKEGIPVKAFSAPGAPGANGYAPYPDKESDRCYQATNHDAGDLCAQWRAMVAAERATEAAQWSNWIAGGGALLSFASVVLVLIALGQGRKANAISEDTAKRQLRAYVAIKHANFGPVIAGRPIPARLELVNTGQTPAYDFRSVSSLVMRPAGHSFKVALPDFGKTGTGVIGGGHSSLCQAATDDSATLTAINDLSNGTVELIFVCVVKYTDAFGASHTLVAKMRNLTNLDEGSFRACEDDNYET